jgi:hypothetical protein
MSECCNALVQLLLTPPTESSLRTLNFKSERDSTQANISLTISYLSLNGESQRDSVPKPRVGASARLPWVAPIAWPRRHGKHRLFMDPIRLIRPIRPIRPSNSMPNFAAHATLTRNPNGVASQSPGFAHLRAYPGWADRRDPNPNGVASLSPLPQTLLSWLDCATLSHLSHPLVTFWRSGSQFSRSPYST